MLVSFIDDHLLQKIALEGFDMVFEGQLASARIVFDALMLLKPGARAPKLGLSLTDLLESQRNNSREPPRVAVMDGGAESDPMLGCFGGLSLFRQGRVEEAKAMLEPLLLQDDAAAKALSRTLLDNEMGDH